MAATRDIHTHRTQAGTFTGNEWALAESTEGRFSVLMPAPFDDYTQISNTSEDLHGYYLRARLPDTTMFSALRAEYADAAESTRNCQRVRELNPFGDSLKSRRVFEFDGHVAVEITTNDGRVWMAMRVVCLETEGMILQVAALPDKIPQAQAMYGKFFDSLKIQAVDGLSR